MKGGEHSVVLLFITFNGPLQAPEVVLLVTVGHAELPLLTAHTLYEAVVSLVVPFGGQSSSYRVVLTHCALY